MPKADKLRGGAAPGWGPGPLGGLPAVGMGGHRDSCAGSSQDLWEAGSGGALPSLYPPVMPNFYGLWSLPRDGGRGLCPAEVGGILLQFPAAASLCGPEAPGLLVLS